LGFDIDDSDPEQGKQWRTKKMHLQVVMHQLSAELGGTPPIRARAIAGAEFGVHINTGPAFGNHERHAPDINCRLNRR
jgi:hypothetical protein